jgi:hypothetical protein
LTVGGIDGASLAEATTHPGRSLDFWRNELATILPEALGNSSNYTLSLLRSPSPVSDDVMKVRMLMPLIPAPLVKYVTPGLLFIAKKAGSSVR